MAQKKVPKSKSKTKSITKKLARGGQAVVDLAKLVNGKRLESNLRIYEAKRPSAVAELQAIRTKNPKANPSAIQEILDAGLVSVEATKGGHSTDFSRAATLYFLASMELRQYKPDKDDTRQLWLSLMFLLDSRAYRFANRFVKAVIWMIKTYLASKAAKGAAGAAQAAGGKAAANAVAKTAAKKAIAKKAAKAVKDSLVPAAIELSKHQLKKAKFANYIIKKSHKELGPVPTVWPSQSDQAKKSNASTRATKKAVSK